MPDENAEGYAAAEAAATEAMMNDIEGSPQQPVDLPPAPVAPTPDAPDASDQPAEPESFTSIDPATLEGDAAELYKSMQADYTKKTQEIAAYTELGYDPETLAQAVDFTSRLTSDPNYAAEVVEELYDLVKQSGIDPFEGKFAEALAPDAGDITPDATPDANDLFGDEVSPEVQQQLSALTNKLSELEQAESIRQEAHEVQELQLHLDKQEAAIVKENPSYTEEDISMIHRLAWSTEGDLIAANDLFQESIQASAERYLSNKASGQNQPDNPSTGNYSEPPTVFESLDDPELDKLALLRLTQALEAEG